jgi:PAS domain S-box-containing protein
VSLFHYLINTSGKIWVEEKLGQEVGLEKKGWLDLKEWLNFIHPEDRTRYLALLNQLLEPASDTATLTYRIKTRADEYLEVSDHLQLVPVKSAKGKLWFGGLSLKDTSPSSEKIQQALYEVARLSVETENLNELLRHLHEIIKSLMPAENFYVALYDKENNLVYFPYFIDQYDSPPAPRHPGRGLTELVLKTGQPVLVSPEVFQQLEAQGRVESVGAPSIDWLGVPLKYGEEVFGVMAVQSYTEGLRYTPEHLNILSFVASHAALVIKKNLAEEARREVENLMIDTFASIQDGVSLLDTNLNIIRVNPAMEKWYSHALPLIGKKCYQAYHGRQEVCHPCPSLRTLKTREPASEIVPKTGPGGKVVGWLDLFAFPLIDYRTGKLKGVIEYVRDITEQKKAQDALLASLKEKEILLKEIHHRVKNNMQIISSLLHLQAQHLKDPEAAEALKQCQNRIRAMALVHERLYREENLAKIDFQEYAEQLLVHLFQAFLPRSKNISFSLQIEAPPLTIEIAIPLGLITTELVTNSLKHAFSPGQTGEILVSLRKEENSLVLKVSDNGKGLPEEIPEKFGLEIVRLLTAQLSGTFKMQSRSGKGTEAEVIFPFPD